MDSRYLIVDKKILPEYFEKVVEASRLLAEGEAPEVKRCAKWEFHAVRTISTRIT